MIPPDLIRSNDDRREVTEVGVVVIAVHATEAQLTDGLPRLRVAGCPAAVKGASGPNRSADHRQARSGRVLVPLRPVVEVVGGEGRFRVGGRAVAVASSEFRVPDAMTPRKSGLVKPAAERFRVGGEAVVRGAS